jgi:hypothetical protein
MSNWCSSASNLIGEHFQVNLHLPFPLLRSSVTMKQFLLAHRHHLQYICLNDLAEVKSSLTCNIPILVTAAGNVAFKFDFCNIFVCQGTVEVLFC